MSGHPIQPLVEIAGVVRFKENRIVRYLLENGGIDLNQLARLDFNTEDRQQFAQLIGYSLSGYGDLSYVTYEALAAADAQREPFPRERIGDLRDMRKRAMPGPVKPRTSAGYYGAQGIQAGPVIRFMGNRRAENQAFVVAAFNMMDELLDEIVRLQAKCGEL